LTFFSNKILLQPRTIDDVNLITMVSNNYMNKTGDSFLQTFGKGQLNNFQGI